MPFVLGNQNEPGGNRTSDLSGSLAIAELEVFAGVLSAEEVLDRFVEDSGTYGATVPTLPVLSSFTGVLNDATTASLSLGRGVRWYSTGTPRSRVRWTSAM